jgi:hypothetical protein
MSPTVCHDDRVRLDEEKLEALRSWGERLRESRGEESAAVGRAILMLAEEVDRLHIELWHARIQPDRGALAENGAPPRAGNEEAPVASSLHARLRMMLRRDAARDPADQSEQSVPGAENERTGSANAWIAALRREE